MGHKLSEQEINELIKQNPETQTFDTCIECGGVQEGLTMRSVKDTLDLICYECIDKGLDRISLDLVKVVKINYSDLKPLGHFKIKWKTRQGHLPNIIPADELSTYQNVAMPLTEEQDNAVVAFMKKNKTDILTDGMKYYTRTGVGFTEVHHAKFDMFRDNVNGFKHHFDI